MARKRKAQQPSPETIEHEVLTEPADAINPYTVLSIDKSATQDQVKTAYRKAALKYHPDKVKPAEQDQANKKFQEIATAYAILSDEKRRRRYDTTGNTSESLDDDDFSWADFFREQSAAMVSGDMINQIKQEYQGSAEEHEDILQAYNEGEGDMNFIYETIMCSNVLEDDERFRSYIDEAIKAGKIQAYTQYTNESKKNKHSRVDHARKEEREAMQLAEELGVKDGLFGAGNVKGRGAKNRGGDEDALKALIQQRQKDRSESFFDQLEAKYGGGKKGKRKTPDEPPEELFQKNTKKSRSRK